MTDSRIKYCAIVILAAGASVRFGKPKQLLSYNGKSLLKHTVEQARATQCSPVAVVLGANQELLRNELQNSSVLIAENYSWEEGIASSIRIGLEKILAAAPDTDGIIFMVCDQPYVSGDLLLSLLEKQRSTGMPIVACHYGNKSGTPALFHRSFFPALMELQGDKGAGKLIMENAEKVARVPFPEGMQDIDTIEDYEALKK